MSTDAYYQLCKWLTYPGTLTFAQDAAIGWREPNVSNAARSPYGYQGRQLIIGCRCTIETLGELKLTSS